MKISRQDVQYVADLANLALQPEEVERLGGDLNAILDYIEQLNQLDTRQVEPMAQVLSGHSPPEISASVLRQDTLRPWFGTEQALANAPAAGAGHFKVPKIIERS